MAKEPTGQTPARPIRLPLVEASALLASVIPAVIVAAIVAIPNHPPVNSTDPEVLKSYITPNEPEIVQMVDETLDAWRRWAYSDFEILSQWVATNIRYVSDRKAHGVDEYFQLPMETIYLGTGDCEDFAFLLCSLLRAYGVPADRVYVAVGEPSEGRYLHAFLVERWYTGEWRAVEPQQGEGSALVIGDMVDFWGEYKIRLCFNDENCLTGSGGAFCEGLANSRN